MPHETRAARPSNTELAARIGLPAAPTWRRDNVKDWHTRFLLGEVKTGAARPLEQLGARVR